MKRAKRYLTLIVTLTLLLLGTALALLLARGNTFSLNDGITETGTIRIQASPSTDLQVFLNEQVQKLTSNNTIENIKPGSYTLKITKSQHGNWQQQVEIRSGLVTDVSVKLFPDSLKLTQITQTNVSMTTITGGGRYAINVIKDSPLGANIGIWRQSLVKSNIPLIDEQPQKIANITAEISTALAANTLTITPAANGERIILGISGNYYVLDTNRYNEPSANNKVNVSYKIDSIKWLKDTSNILIQSGNLVVDYEVTTGKTSLITYQTEVSPIYGIQQNSVVYLLNQKLYKYADGTSQLLKLENVTLPDGIKNIFTVSGNDTSILLGTESSLYYVYTTQSYIGNLGDYALVSAAPSARNFLVLDNTGAIRSISIDISLTRNTVEVLDRATALPNTLVAASIAWDNSGNFFAFRQADMVDKLFTADKNGNNLSLILLSENIFANTQYGITPSGNSLIILLNDNQDSGTRSNLYELNFVLQ